MYTLHTNYWSVLKNKFKFVWRHIISMPLDNVFYKKVRQLVEKPRAQYTPEDALVKQEATLIALAHNPFFRGETVIVPHNKTVEEAKADSYNRDMSEGWKSVTPQMANALRRGISGAEDEKAVGAHLKEFLQGVPVAKRTEYETAWKKLRQELYQK